ncbi:MAG TPA: aspartate kinase [Candidatus Ventrousia excrementavium]|uniref:Aspartokinase n=1 Tax=Candidatus Ventrousia excrementavium TaxID=2840961 RepID=A0A9D1LLL0_9CLOT|nr:aspartate kinase [Candidatus Ventrousia excrementavium]
MALIVEKFGGSSLANIDKLRNAASIVAADYKKENQLVVVVSAQGDSTDHLVEQAEAIGRRISPREMDVLLSTGEQASMALMAMMLMSMGVPAVSLCGWQAGIRTDALHSKARIEYIDTRRICAELAQDRVVVVAGFQGISPSGDITTIGRGGSDTTAVALAAVLEADVCRIYTDVDGVYSADPRVVQNAVRHYEIDYDEMLELASQGAQVLHNRSVEMAKRFGVQLEVKSSFINGVGTRVREVVMEKRSVSGVARDQNVALVTLEGLQDQPGNIWRLFSGLTEQKINVDIILQPPAVGQQTSITFSVPRESLDHAVEMLTEHRGDLMYESISVDDRVCKISIVGAGMASDYGVASRMFESLYQAGVNVRCVTTSEIKISVIVSEEDSDRAFIAVHDAFF